MAYTEGEIRAIMYQYALIRELKLQLRLAREENARISLGRAWQGWGFMDDKLISPKGMEYFQWEIRGPALFAYQDRRAVTTRTAAATR